MKHTESLKKNYQFRHVYNKGRSIANRHLVLYILPNGGNMNHLGLSVSKKVGNSVVRSRVTRLIRESYRLREDRIKKGYDLVFIARNISSEADFWEIDRSVSHLIKKHNLYVSES